MPAPLDLAGLFTYDVDVEGLTNLRLSQKPVRGCSGSIWLVGKAAGAGLGPAPLEAGHGCPRPDHCKHTWIGLADASPCRARQLPGKCMACVCTSSSRVAELTHPHAPPCCPQVRVSGNHGGAAESPSADGSVAVTIGGGDDAKAGDSKAGDAAAAKGAEDDGHETFSSRVYADEFAGETRALV